MHVVLKRRIIVQGTNRHWMERLDMSLPQEVACIPQFQSNDTPEGEGAGMAFIHVDRMQGF